MKWSLPNIVQLDLLGEFSQMVKLLKLTSSCLATIVSRALQPQDGRIRCPVDRNRDFFLTSHTEFFLFMLGQCGDNCE